MKRRSSQIDGGRGLAADRRRAGNARQGLCVSELFSTTRFLPDFLVRLRYRVVIFFVVGVIFFCCC